MIRRKTIRDYNISVAEIGEALVERHKGNRRVPPIQNALVNIG